MVKRKGTGRGKGKGKGKSTAKAQQQVPEDQTTEQNDTADVLPATTHEPEHDSGVEDTLPVEETKSGVKRKSTSNVTETGHLNRRSSSRSTPSEEAVDAAPERKMSRRSSTKRGKADQKLEKTSSQVGETNEASDEPPSRPKRSQSTKSSMAKTPATTSTTPVSNDQEKPKSSLKKGDTLIIAPSTSTKETKVSIAVTTISPGPSTSLGLGVSQLSATPKQLIRIASLKKGLSRQEIESILPGAAALSDKALSIINQPSSSDPETKALIANSMKLMRQASLRKTSTVDSLSESEPPAKKRKLSPQKTESLPKANSSTEPEPRAKRSSSVKKQLSETHGTKVTVTPEDKLDSDVEMVCDVHPDTDPVYIRERLVELAEDVFRVSTLCIDLITARDIPTREQRQAIEAKRARKEFIANHVNVKGLLDRFLDPQLRFERDQTRIRSKLYIKHAHVFLRNEFKRMTASYVQKVFKKEKNCLTPAYLKLNNEYNIWVEKGRKTNRQKYLRSARTDDVEYPEDADEEFYYERVYIRNRENVFEHIKCEEEEKIKKFEKAKEEGQLRLCEICYSDDIFLEDMVACGEGHHFCQTCVHGCATEQIGQGKPRVSCMESDCVDEFPFYALSKILSQERISILFDRMQEDQVRLAGIEGVESCPFCPYSVIIPDHYPTNTLICERPGCKRSSCRKCKFPGHEPMSCKEYEVERNKRQKDFVENTLSEALIRECPNCHTRFLKDEGCNYMTCPTCYTHMCYMCRERIDGYDHFRNNPECSQYVNTTLFHQAEVLEAYNNLADRFREANPNMGEIEVPEMYRPEDVNFP